MASSALQMAVTATPVASMALRQSPSQLSAKLRTSELMGRPASLALKQTAAAASPAGGMPAGAMGVRAAKREEELTEIRGMSTSEIEQAVFDLKGELFLLRARQATRLEYKASEFGRIRKRIARMLTVRREREITQGVDRRASKKMDREWRKSVVPRAPPSYNPDDWKK